MLNTKFVLKLFYFVTIGPSFSGWNMYLLTSSNFYKLFSSPFHDILVPFVFLLPPTTETTNKCRFLSLYITITVVAFFLFWGSVFLRCCSRGFMYDLFIALWFCPHSPFSYCLNIEKVQDCFYIVMNWIKFTSVFVRNFWPANLDLS